MPSATSLRPLAVALAVAAALTVGLTATAEETLPLVFEDDFSKGADRWETTDPAAWKLGTDGERATWGLTTRKSAYEPKVRSPHNVALIEDLELSDTVITFRVRSTRDTGNHRDCCVFFNWRDPEHFYHVHLGATPDPASGQIMIVDGAPRRPLSKNTKPVPWDDQWHTVRLVRDAGSGRIAVFFDDLDTPLIEAEDRTFTAGRVGIGSFDDMNEFAAVRIQGRKAGVTPRAAPRVPTFGRVPPGPAPASSPTGRP